MERKGKSQFIAVGDQVIMTTDKYKVPNDIIGRIWKVTSLPKYEQGSRSVHLEGYRGPYPVDGLRVVG